MTYCDSALLISSIQIKGDRHSMKLAKTRIALWVKRIKLHSASIQGKEVKKRSLKRQPEQFLGARTRFLESWNVALAVICTG